MFCNNVASYIFGSKKCIRSSRLKLQILEDYEFCRISERNLQGTFSRLSILKRSVKKVFFVFNRKFTEIMKVVPRFVRR